MHPYSAVPSTAQEFNRFAEQARTVCLRIAEHFLPDACGAALSEGVRTPMPSLADAYLRRRASSAVPSGAVGKAILASPSSTCMGLRLAAMCIY